MNLNFFAGACRIAAAGAILLGSASCIDIDETLGKNFIPTDQKWDVFTPEPEPLTEIRMQIADLSGYSTTRFTFGSINDEILGTCIKSTSFTLVPVTDSIDFGKNTKIRGFHFTAAIDTLSTADASQNKIIQNVYVSELRAPLDSNVMYAGSFMDRELREKYLNPDELITDGIPVYAGGDSLSFEFSRDFAEKLVERLKTTPLDSMDLYLKSVPGIYITTDAPAGNGGRINMFNVEVSQTDGYVTGNYAELKITADYGSRKDVDTSFVFVFGLGDFLKNLSNTSNLIQYAFNAGYHDTAEKYPGDGIKAEDVIYVEGGCGVKPVIKASEIKDILDKQLAEAEIEDINQVVINKATIVLPYDVEGNYPELDYYPMILSPTVRLKSENGKYVSFAGLTDSSISSENQGEINRSLSVYSPDISHHVQEILKLDKTDEDFAKKIDNYDIWFLIMHEERTTSSNSANSSYMQDYYNNLMYNSYYNNMMYNPYGYGGYGYGGYGYGYGGYGYGGYGYSNYYNYLMMAMYSSSYGSSSTKEVTTEMDKDRYYMARLNGPGLQSGAAVPQLKITFSAPKTAERK